MPNLIELKANFSSSKNYSKPGTPELPADGSVTVESLIGLKKDLVNVEKYWSNKSKDLEKIIVDAHYNKTIAKSRRIEKLLFFPGNMPSNNDIVGAKFKTGTNKHIISYALSMEYLEKTIVRINQCIEYMQNCGYDIFDRESLIDFDLQHKDNCDDLAEFQLSKSVFIRIIVDANYVESFSIPKSFRSSNEGKIVTFYNIDDMDKLLRIAGLSTIINSNDIIDGSVLLTPLQQKILEKNAPYLVSMDVKDISEIPEIPSMASNEDQSYFIKDPKNEPIIGVIDTQFKNTVYFKDWVEYENVLNHEGIKLEERDYYHGTAVTSIIVDGPRLNPRLDDGCGSFRVKHFGVATDGSVSVHTIVKHIDEWLSENPDIHVWNISLGSILEADPNSISFLAAKLDEIQSENRNIIFVIAGTNFIEGKNNKKIGAPADSINSLVVNAVNSMNKKVSYARKGPVLAFFQKPDVCVFGGDVGDEMTVYGFLGTRKSYGTSFAAPWISRKMAYLIDKMNLSVPVAKALIIDSAISWDPTDVAKKEPDYYGYGIVPTRIEDVINSKRDEIKFYFNINISSYRTYLYDIPMPTVNEKFPFIAKATMCYATDCSRNQGVDYTNTELDFKFGRVKKDGMSGHIKAINDDQQYELGHFTYEEDSRKLFRKWDNVKTIVQNYSPRLRDKSRFGDQSWGVDIKLANRNSKSEDKKINVGIVITLKELHGQNRSDVFMQLCRLRHFVVNEIDIENRIELDNHLQQEIEFDD
ncbi:S8 family peptidase [Candidatus Saccharibacteria bacterium]|nr:S8 family peptidase [Candidatus Saccharibacteria bacterium]